MKIAVLGGGNGSFAAAGDFALAGHEVRLWRRNPRDVEAHRAQGGTITVIDRSGRRDVRLAMITSSIAEAIDAADLILCPAPAFAQPAIAELAAPHLRDGQVVFLPPGTFGSYIFARAAQGRGQPRRNCDRGDRDPAVAGAQAGTLCRSYLGQGRAAADRRVSVAPRPACA